MTIQSVVTEVHGCRACAAYLPFAPKPILRVGSGSARLLIVGQAPGSKVHESGIPWDDASGNRLRQWLGLTPEIFYDDDKVAILPMGFCYPGKGRSGDMPPRPECAPLWHAKILSQMNQVKLTILIGQYAQARYLGAAQKATLTETVRAWRTYLAEGLLPIVHPSPRNGIWLRKNPWFESEIVPALRTVIEGIL